MQTRSLGQYGSAPRPSPDDERRDLLRVPAAEGRQTSPEELARLERILGERTSNGSTWRKPPCQKEATASALFLLDSTEDTERLCDLVPATRDVTAGERAVCTEQIDVVERQRERLEVVTASWRCARQTWSLMTTGSATTRLGSVG